MDPQPQKFSADEENFVSVYPTGGRYAVTLAGVPILIPVTRGDGKSIATHICTPNFGKDIKNLYGLAQHGQMRNTLLQIHSLSTTSCSVEHNITDAPGSFPEGIRVTQTYTVEPSAFHLKMIHANTSGISIPVNAGQHCYFAAPKGYKNTKINGHDVTEQIEKNDSVDLPDHSLIEIPGLPKLLILQKGFHKAVLWVYSSDKGKFDPHYVCIEPMEYKYTDFGEAISMIAPRDARVCTYSLHIAS